jgi:hypothetical protein
MMPYSFGDLLHAENLHLHGPFNTSYYHVVHNLVVTGLLCSQICLFITYERPVHNSTYFSTLLMYNHCFRLRSECTLSNDVGDNMGYIERMEEESEKPSSNSGIA